MAVKKSELLAAIQTGIDASKSNNKYLIEYASQILGNTLNKIDYEPEAEVKEEIKEEAK
tara:strand:+ start:5497 stop:5673 length:177 start_codon:yes stop_codon:yes gene_type:complete